jgi:hypothetical protein
MSKNSSATLSVAKTEVKLIPVHVCDSAQGKERVIPAGTKITTIEELKNRATVLTLLNRKHDELTEKIKRLERFSIVHDTSNARITVVDASGEEFESGSPKSIAKLIDFWKEEFSDAITENEEKMKALFA